MPHEIKKQLDADLEKHRSGKGGKEVEPELEFQFWDFAGQDVYYNAHQVSSLFVSKSVF